MNYADHQAMKRVVFFDGVCVLCNRSVQWLLAKDKKNLFHYAPLQGTTAKSMLTETQTLDLNSMVYATEQDGVPTHVLDRSDAVLTVLRDLGGFWKAISWLRVLPRFLRDPVYNLVAKNRYRWFGKKEMGCAWATPEQQARILD